MIWLHIISSFSFIAGDGGATFPSQLIYMDVGNAVIAGANYCQQVEMMVNPLTTLFHLHMVAKSVGF